MDKAAVRHPIVQCNTYFHIIEEVQLLKRQFAETSASSLGSFNALELQNCPYYKTLHSWPSLITGATGSHSEQLIIADGLTTTGRWLRIKMG